MREICSDQAPFTSHISHNSKPTVLNKYVGGFWCKNKRRGTFICFLKTWIFLHHMMEWYGIFVDYCDVFISCLDSHSDSTHSLQMIHDEITHFSKSVLVNKQTHLGRPKGGYIFSKCSFLGEDHRNESLWWRPCYCFKMQKEMLWFVASSFNLHQCNGNSGSKHHIVIWSLLEITVARMELSQQYMT